MHNVIEIPRDFKVIDLKYNDRNL